MSTVRYATDVVFVLCETLNEVADDGTIDWAVELLQTVDSPLTGSPLLRMVDSYLGIKSTFPSFGIDGNTTPEEYQQLRKLRKEKYDEARLKQHLRWSRLRQFPPEYRYEAAISEWRRQFTGDPGLMLRSHFMGSIWLYEYMEPLVRLGMPATDLLRKQKDAESDLLLSAVWEVVLAAITGVEDRELVKVLLNAGAVEKRFGCEIIIASRSRHWLPELTSLQLEKRSSANSANHVSAIIASVHRQGGVEALERAAERWSWNRTAVHAIRELEERKRLGAPPLRTRFVFEDQRGW